MLKKFFFALVFALVISLVIWGSVSYQENKTKGDFDFSGKGLPSQAREYIQSAIGWVNGVGKDGKVESNSSFERREIGNHTYYIAKAWINNYSINGQDKGRSIVAIIVAHSEITNSTWTTFCSIERLDEFLTSIDRRSIVIPADDLALEMNIYEEPPAKPKTPWSIELSIRSTNFTTSPYEILFSDLFDSPLCRLRKLYERNVAGKRPTPGVLAPGDTIRVSFKPAAEFNQSEKIEANGTVSLRLVGEVHAAGKTTAQFQAELTNRYRDQLQNSDVIVTLDTVAIPVVISGEVQKPVLFSTTEAKSSA